MSERAVPAPRAWRPMALLSRNAVLVALVLLVLLNVAITPHFVSWETLNVNLTQVTTIIIVAIGMTMVIATGGIDLSVGALMAIAGALAPLIFEGKLFAIPSPLVGVALAYVLPVLAAGAFGWFNGLLVTRYRIQPIIATLVLFIAGRGIGQVMTNGNLQPFRNPPFQVIAMGHVAHVPVQVIAMLLIGAAAAWAVRRTVFGRRILAIGGNERAARLAGIPVDRTKRLVYVISGLCSGLAGLIVVAINSSSDANTNGMGMELDAIAAVAVGGTPLMGGRALIVGTILGALIIQIVRYMLLANGVPDSAAMVVKAALIVLAVALQFQGRRA